MNNWRIDTQVNNQTALKNNWRVTLSRYDLLILEQCCFLDNIWDGAFALFFGPTLGHLTDLFGFIFPLPREFAIFLKEKC